VSVRELPVRESGIRLGQLLKLAGLVDSGGEVRPLLAAGSVRVNGAVESRRGAQLHPGDVVDCGSEQIRLTRSE
jgi:ribosome-associated protein